MENRLQANEEASREYAPIGIHTLNRFEHFRRCVQSLAENNIAKDSDLFVSLDFPPSDKYTEGHGRIKEYLENGIHGFRNVYVFMQSENLGATGNALFLHSKMRECSDRFIATEDDNIFSKNFLEYMNWCLKEFEDNDSIIQASGFSQPIAWRKDSMIQFLSNEYNAWGVASWYRKWDRAFEFITQGELKDALNDHKCILKILKLRPDFLPEILRYRKKKDTTICTKGQMKAADIAMTMYMILNHKITIMPTITKVNNMGYDGSGLNCASLGYKQFELDSNIKWRCTSMNIKDYTRTNMRKLRRFFVGQKVKNLLNRLKN